MKILITGSKGLAQELAFVYGDHDVTNVSQSTGYNILLVKDWASEFLSYDLVFNCAYSGIGQLLVLEQFYQYWHCDPTKTIVSIGSKVITQPRSEIELDRHYWPYRTHKQTLQAMHDSMWPNAQCDLKIINPGAFDSAMVAHLDVEKISLYELAISIKKHTEDPIIKRVDLWL